MKAIRFLIIPLLGCSILSGGLSLHAQVVTYSPDQITQMVAPIALYPDALMSQVLMAATYPDQVTESDSWVRANPGLAGSALDGALATATWDPSVISLCKFPTVLDRMAQNIAWTTDLGNAFLYQRTDVMNAVQDLRSAAYRNGTLRTTQQARVVVQGPDIVIQPYTPEVIYVPAYQPAVVYGGYWNYPTYYYPSVWAPWPGYSFVNGFAWGIGFAFGNILFGGCDWGHHDVWVNNTVINNCTIYHNTPYYHEGYGGGYGHQQWDHRSGGVDYARGRSGAPYGGRSYERVNGIETASLRGNRGDAGTANTRLTRDNSRSMQRDTMGNTTRDTGRAARGDMAANTARNSGRPTMNGSTNATMRGPSRMTMDDPARYRARGADRPANYAARSTTRPTVGNPAGTIARGGSRMPLNDPAAYAARGTNRTPAHGPTGYAGPSVNRPAQRGSAGYTQRGYNRPTVNSSPNYSGRNYSRPSLNSSPNYSARGYNRPSPSGPSSYGRSGGSHSYARPSAPGGRASAPAAHAGGGRVATTGPRGGHGGAGRR